MSIEKLGEISILKRALKAWVITEHTGWVDKPDGTKKLEKTKSYCYIFTPE